MSEPYVPSFDEFLKAAKPLNPTYTDQEIKTYWSELYSQPLPRPDYIPTREEFIEAAKPLNPSYTTAEMSSFYDDEYGKWKEAPKAEQGNIARGFNVAMEQLPQLAAGVEMGVGAAGEWAFGKGGVSSDLKASGQQRYAEKTKDLQALSRETDSLNTSWERAKSGDIGALQDWAAYGLGYIGGQAIQALATAGVGSIAGKLVLRPAVASLMEGMVAKETAALAGTKAVEGLTAEGVGKLATANVAGRIGQNTALAVTAGGMEGGEIFGDLVSEANREGRDLTGYELARAFGMTIAAGSLEFLGDKLGMVDIVMGKSRLAAGVTGRLARAGLTAAESAAIEGSTEFTQTLLEQVGKGKDPFSQASIREAIDSAALGILGGTVIGGARGLLGGAPTADPTVDPTAPLGTPPGMLPETPPGIPPRTNTVAPGDEISAGTTLTKEVDRAIQESSDSIGTQSSLPMTLAGVTPESLDQVIREAEAQASPEAQTVAPEAPAHSIADIHALATESNIPWDDDPEFMTFTESVTGKRHLDELTPQERDTLYAALEARVQAKSETITGEPTRTPVPPLVNEPLTTLAQEAETTRQAAIQAERARLQALAVPPAADPALVPRNQLPDAANADMLARAEKGEADLASLVGTDTRSLLQFLRDRGGVQDQGKELTGLGVDTNRKPFQKRLIQATGLTLDDAAEAAHEAGLIPSRDMNLLLQAIDRELRQGTGPAWITEATSGSREKLTRARVDAAIQKILADEGQDVGKDVARVKALLLADPEFASSGFALKTDADVQAMITEAKAGQQEIPVPPPTIGERPIYGAEKPLENMPLFSKEAQTPAPEQTELLPAAPAAPAPVVAKPTRPLPKGASPVTAAEPTAPSTAAATEKKALQALKLKNMLSKQKKAPAAEATQDRVNPGEVNRFISEMRVEDPSGGQRAVAGMDPRIMKVLGGNLYSGDLGKIAVKEMIQNAVDSILATTDPTAGTVTVRSSSKDRTIQVSDNGIGMSPDTVMKEFVDIGGSKKEAADSAGGFGIAKVAIFSNSKRIVAVTRRRDGANIVQTTITGTGEDWMNPNVGLSVTIDRQATGTETGTNLTVTLSPDVEFVETQVSYWLHEFMTSHRLPMQFDILSDGRTIRSFSSSRVALIKTISFKGGTMEVFAEPDTTSTTMVTVAILNNGLPQFNDFIGIGGKPVHMPRGIVVNVKASSNPEAPNYPFSPDRERLRDDANFALQAYLINELALDAINAERDAYIRALQNAPQIGMSIYRLLDTTGTIDPAQVTTLAAQPHILAFTEALGTVFTEIQTRLSTRSTGLNGKGGRPVSEALFTGLGLGKYLGVNIHGEMIEKNSKNNLILINPFLLVKEVDSGVGSGDIPADKKELFLAQALVATMVHELSHQTQRSHEEQYAGELTRNLGHVILDGGRFVEPLWNILQQKDGLTNDTIYARIEKDYNALAPAWSSGTDIFSKISTLSEQGPDRDRSGEGAAQTSSRTASGRGETVSSSNRYASERNVAPRTGLPRSLTPPSDFPLISRQDTSQTPGFLPAIPLAEIDSQRLTDVIMLGQTLWDMEPTTFEDWYVTMADGLDADHLPYLSAAWSFLLERPVALDLREAQLKPLLDYAVKLATQGVVEREAFLARFTKFLGQKTSAPYAEGLFAAIFNPREVFNDIAIRDQQQANQPSGGLLDETGRGGTGTDPVDVPTPPVGDGARADEDERLPGERPGPVADPTDRGSGGPGMGLPGADLPGGTGNAGRRRNQKSGLPTERGGAAPGGVGGEIPGDTGLETGISVEEKADAVTEKTNSSYVPYESPLNIPGQQPHPGAVVESASLASTKLPPTTYVPNLPKEIIEKGLLSSVQLVPVVYAGQSHAKTLPDGTRQGYFIGDGTGIGKGREIAAIIMDNMRRGYQTAVWVSETTELMGEAIRDWVSIGGDPKLFSLQQDTEASGVLPTSPGIIFTTYAMLRAGSEVEKGVLVTRTKKSGAVAPSRLDQLIARLGQGFSGVIAFDESHNMANTDMGSGPVSTQALAGVKLTYVFTDARVLYVSATAAKNPQSLMYAERLGLWGEKTGFASKTAFLAAMEKGGLGAMEVLIRDLKADGKYIARTLDYADVSYANLEHPLDSVQTYAYNESADAWNDIYTQMESALKLTQTTEKPIGPFRAAQQRFFEQMLSSFALTPALPAMQTAIADGHVVVAQLINTNAAAQEEQLKAGILPEDLDLSPKQIMVSFLTRQFPIRDKTTYDLQGNAIQRENPAATAMRDALLKKYSNLSGLPQSPIDLIVNTLGAKNVAEVTGRKQRRLIEEDGTKTMEDRSDQQVSKEVREFKDDTRRALIFSQKGGTGQSYHASRQEKNQRKRYHYIVQLGYRADKVIQALGRTHRSNQASAPSVFLLLTNAKGHKRFVATIAKRLDALGAMTQGQRQGTASGLISAQNNFDSIYATEALQSLLSDLFYNQVATVADNRAVFTRMGFMSLMQQSGALDPKKTPKVETFLNRLLGLRLVDQDQVFDAFYSRLVNLVARAEEAGTLDTGIRTVQADGGITKVSSQVAYTNPDSGAVSMLDTFEAKQSIKFTDFDALSAGDFFRNDRSQNVWAFSQVRKWTNASGNAEATYSLTGPVYGTPRSIDAKEMAGYTKVTPEEARAFWNRTIAEHPQFTTTTYHMVTGGLLRIWERLPVTSQRIVRLQTTDGTRYIGRLIENSDVKNTKLNLGLDQMPITLSAERLIEKVLTEGSKVRLSNGTILQSRKLNNQTRVELARAAWLDEKFIKQLRETVPPSSEIYYLLPQDRAQAATVLRDIMRQHEAVEIVDVNEKGTLREERLPYGEPKTTTSDVGERIPGARKHKYEHLKMSDIERMTPEERDSLVTKQSIWKPDYQQYVSDGMEPRAAALLKVAYDGMPATLRSLKRSKGDNDDSTPEEYATFHQAVTWMNDRVNDIPKTEEFIQTGVVSYDSLYSALTQSIPKEVTNLFGYSSSFWMGDPSYALKTYATQRSIDKLLSQGFPNQVPWTRQFRVTQKREGAEITEKFLLKGWEDLRAGVIFKNDIALADPSVVKDLREFGLWVVLDKEGSVKAYAAGRAAAEAKAEALYEAAKTDKEKGYERPYLKEVVREGPSVRGDQNVTSEDFQREFLLKGVQFGNYVSEGAGAQAVAERQSHLNRAYDALQDLADVLGIPTSAIGLGGTLGLAIGARGKGGKGAPAAHYEPTTVVINLTKMKGAGALAHEWGHALDYYLGQIGESWSGSMSGGQGQRPLGDIVDLPSLRPELKKALSTVMSRLYTSKKEQAQAVREVEFELEKVIADVSNKLEHLEDSKKIPTPALWTTANNKRYLKSLDWRLPSLGETKEKLAKKLLALTNEPEPAGGYGTVESSYYREAGKIVGKKDYWTQPTELFARAFESYVQDTLGRKSQYLVHSTGPESRLPTGNPYPEGLDRVEIHAAFAALFEEFVRIPVELTMTIGEEGTAPVAVEGVLLRSPKETYGRAERSVHDILGRLQRLIGVVRTAVGILPTSEGVIGDRDGIRTLGLGINRAFMADGVVDLRGQQIETAEDLATLAQVFRDPSIETLRIFYTKNKQVVGQEGISSRLPGSIDVFVSETGKTIPASTFFNTMQQRMEALGADGYYLLHNHPGGDSSASDADIESTQQFSEAVPGFLDHVIIDSNEYTTIGRGTVETTKKDFGPDQLLTPAIAHTLLARKLTNADEVAQFGKELQSPMGFATVVYLNAKNLVQAIQEVPVTFFEDLAKAQAYLGEHGRAFGSDRIITYYHTTNILDPALVPIYQNIKSLIREGFLAEHVFDSPDLSRRFSAREREVMANKGMVLGVQTIPSLRTVGEVFGTPTQLKVPALSQLDFVIRKLQDSNIDLVRLVNAMKDSGRVVPTELNPILRQDASSGRIMNLTDTFVNEELKPLIALLNTHQISLAQLDEYLIARHAEEANFHLQEINPDLEDNEALSGMTNAKARSILDRAAPAMPSLAQHADRIIQSTRQLSVEYGLESQEDIDIVSRAYLFYVPLQRAGFPEESSSGRGASVRGSSLTSRVGGTQAPINVLANIAMAREAVIGRGERQRPITALAGLLSLHPDKNIATLARPVPISYTDPETGIRMKVPGDVGPYKFPTIKFVNKETGRVEFRPDPNYKGRDNVVNFRVRGIDYAIIFNEFNPRALEMAKALNGLGVTELNGVMAGIATATRYIAAINTQYDPVFGLINFVRDAQFAMVSLSSTPLKGKRGAVLSYAVEAIHSIYSDQRALRSGEAPTSLMHVWYQRFKEAGGQTGFRQRYESSTERSEAIQRLLDPDWWKRTAIGKGLTVGGLLAKPEALFVSEVARPIRDWLTDYNQAMENAIRLSVFRVAIEQGLSDIEAASLAKNITVNFNRKGQITAQMGALFAFFNAAVQGTARIHEILFDPRSPFTLSETGKKIIRGGILLGVLEAFLLAMSGFGDDEPPEWKKSRNTIIPVPFTDKGYIAIPMPLGLNIIPNLGRLAAEAFIHGRIPKRIMSFAESSFDMLSPVGSSSSVMQLLAPTLLDPVVALAENKDWTGRKIYRKDFDESKPTPGFTRGRDNASPWAMSLAQIINYATGGTAYVPGVSSPTPEAIDYLIKQVTGGVGREFTGLVETVTTLQAGDAVNIQRVPLVGRIIGTATDTAAVRNAFYEHLHAVSETKQELKGRTEHGEETASYRRDHPESQLLNSAHTADATVKRLHKEKNRLVKLNAPHERVKLLDMQVLATMKRFNEQYSRVAP